MTRVDWQLDAACKLSNPTPEEAALHNAKFYPSRKDSPEPAYAYCRVCTVRLECLTVAVEDEKRIPWQDRVVAGIRGGQSANARLAVLQGRLTVAQLFAKGVPDRPLGKSVRRRARRQAGGV